MFQKILAESDCIIVNLTYEPILIHWFGLDNVELKEGLEFEIPRNWIAEMIERKERFYLDRTYQLFREEYDHAIENGIDKIKYTIHYSD
jgi:hypothetical protein